MPSSLPLLIEGYFRCRRMEGVSAQDAFDEALRTPEMVEIAGDAIALQFFCQRAYAIG